MNSENTNMQMSRFYERSVSGAIRYLGARKDEVGDVVEDVIVQELASQMKGRNSVQPTTVLVTGPGELATSNNVRKICHVAAVFGQVGFGYRPIDNLEQCVTRVLDALIACRTAPRSAPFFSRCLARVRAQPRWRSS